MQRASDVHYCLYCIDVFVTTRGIDNPHTQTYLHVKRAHPDVQLPSLACHAKCKYLAKPA